MHRVAELAAARDQAGLQTVSPTARPREAIEQLQQQREKGIDIVPVLDDLIEEIVSPRRVERCDPRWHRASRRGMPSQLH